MLTKEVIRLDIIQRMNLARILFHLVAAVSLGGCVSGGPGTVSSPTPRAGKPAVRNVDCRQASELRALAEHARQLGNEAYPKILALLVEDTLRSPQSFDIVFKRPLASGNLGEASGAAIRLNGDWFARNPSQLDPVLIHELVHVAQQYPAGAPPYWVEGMADFVRYKLGYTNGWSCPQCSEKYPHYTSGYWCAGAFLLYVDATCGSNVVRQLNTALRRGAYADTLFVKATGKTLDVLWAEFEKTPAFTSRAAEINKLYADLGYVNGKPPKDIATRLSQLPGGALTIDAANFLVRLFDQSQLPGLVKMKGEHGQISLIADPLDLLKESNSEAYPVSRTVEIRKSGDLSIRHYTIVRAAPGTPWQLQQAWRTSPDGRIIEEYPIP